MHGAKREQEKQCACPQTRCPPAHRHGPSPSLLLSYAHPSHAQPNLPPPFFLWQTLYGANTIQIHRRPGKMGLGSAYVDGLKLVRGQFVVLMDADLSHHPKFIPALYR